MIVDDSNPPGGGDDRPPFWVWLVVLGTLAIAVSVFIGKVDFTEPAKVDAAIGKPAPTKVVKTDYDAYYTQRTDFVCNGKREQYTVVTSYRFVAVLVVEQSTGTIYNISSFRQKRGHCVPVSVGKRIIPNGVVVEYYNSVIDRLYPNNKR